MQDRLNKARLGSNDVPRKRTYDTTRRRAQANRTSQTILAAAHELFVERGYANTTIRQIAERAEVSVDSVYAHHRSKPVILRAVIDRAYGGPNGAEVAERDWVRRIRSAPVEEQLALLGTTVAQLHDTLAPLLLAVHAAVDADPDAAQIWAERSTDRLVGLDRFAGRLVRARTGPGPGRAETRDILYAVTSPQLYGLFVLDRGWSADRYARWLTDALVRELGSSNS